MLNPRDAQASNIVVTGTLTICSMEALILLIQVLLILWYLHLLACVWIGDLMC